MIVGQLWYGWSPHGVDGVNREQIVAASGALADRRQPATIAALARCYRPERASFGWAEHDGLVFVFNRTPTGRDVFGRPGAFFVHLLVSSSGTLTPRQLAGLNDAPIWQRAPPEEPVGQLSPITDPEQLGLGWVADVSDQLELAALAGYLRNLAELRRSSIDLEPPVAVAVAARISELVPDAVGLLSFSTAEEAEHATGYDLVAGPPPTEAFRAIAGDDEPGPIWLAAATLLRESAGGEATATSIVSEALAEAGSPVALAQRLADWAAIGHDDGAGAISPERWDRIARSRGLTTWMLTAPRAGKVVSAIAERIPGALATLLRAPGESIDDALVESLVRSWAELPPSEAVAHLAEFGDAHPSLAAPTAAKAVVAWHVAGLTGRMSAADAHTLLRLCVDAKPDAELARAIDGLLSRSDLAPSVFVDGTLPHAWRVESASRSPGAVPPAELVRAVLHDGGLLRAVVGAPGGDLFDALGDALASADPASAVVVAREVNALCRGEAQRWLWDAVVRTGARERLDQVRALLALRHVTDPAWQRLLLETYVDVLREERDSTRPLTLLPWRTLSPERGDESGVWADVLKVSEALGAGTRVADRSLSAAVRSAAALGTSGADVATELIVDALVRSANAPTARPQSLEAWWAYAHAVSVAGVAGEPVVGAMLRAIARLRGERSRAAMNVALWAAEEVDGGHLPAEALTRERATLLGASVTSALDRDTLHELSARFRARPAQKWLRDVARTGRSRRGIGSLTGRRGR